MPPVRNYRYVLYHTILDFSLMGIYYVIGKNVFKVRAGKDTISQGGIILIDLFLAKVTKTILILKGVIPENPPERGPESGPVIIPIIYPK